VVNRLEQQTHRRFIKTHTPLDGVPLDERATYVVVGRHPLDVAISLYHQGSNLDRHRIRQLTGQPRSERAEAPPLSLPRFLDGWMAEQADPRHHLDTLPGLLLHATDAWARREHDNVVLLHYDEMARDLDGVMRGLADRLGIAIAEDRWPVLVESATFEAMKARAAAIAPDPRGVLKDPKRFFRRGTPGEGRELLSTTDQATYAARASALAPPDVLAWLHGVAG